MKNKVKLLKVLCCLFLLHSLSSSAVADEWHTDFEKAQKESRRSGKPLLLDFTGSDWCHWCIRLDEEVFETSEFKDWARRRVVLCKVDFPREMKLPEEQAAANKKLAQFYDIEGFPTIVFLSPKKVEIGRFGYAKGGGAAWTHQANRIIYGDRAKGWFSNW